MSTGTDRFFEEMLTAAKQAARKDVKAELQKAKRQASQYKKETIKLLKQVAVIQKRDVALDKKLRSIEYREKDIKLAEKEITHILDQFEKIKSDKVTTRTVVRTATVRTLCPRTNTKFGWQTIATPQSKALSVIAKRIHKETK